MTTSPKPHSLRRTIALAILSGFTITLLSLAIESAMIPGQMALVQHQSQPAGVVEFDPAAELVDQHDCWVGNPPVDQVGEIPGHVVVTADGEARYGGRNLVHKALQQIFEGDDHGLTVYGFCR